MSDLRARVGLYNDTTASDVVDIITALEDAGFEVDFVPRPIEDEANLYVCRPDDDDEDTLTFQPSVKTFDTDDNVHLHDT